MSYEAVIGLEIHAQLKTESKLFCSCSTRFGKEPNHNTCPVCLGHPGVLPVLNRRAVEYAIRAALATDCEIRPVSIFARKNYFYPDLPKGYQVSQFELPIAEHGYMDITDDNGNKKRIGITRIHMEEDAGKLVHGGVDDPGSYVDLNRAGVPLIEIVSEPDMSTPHEAGDYLRRLRSIVRYLGICDGNMEEGSFRCDANISIRPVGQTELGIRAELKNMNSFRFVERGLEYEINRQIALLENGQEVVQETRLYDSDLNETRSMRSKEEAHDYRYFPEPDLPPLIVDEKMIEAQRELLPELATQKVKRFVENLQLPADDAEILCVEKEVADYFEAAISAHDNPKAIANWIINELMREAKGDEGIGSLKVTPAAIAGLVKLIDGGTISGKIAKKVFEQMLGSGKMPEQVVQEQDLTVISDEGQLRDICTKIVQDNPQQAQQFRDGKTKVMGFFVGQVMKQTKGKADPKSVNEILKELLA
jgi:aspartyl-tRNA(Asn)/glutamyl-tRNA(Gln) amidotransferase subunit B